MRAVNLREAARAVDFREYIEAKLGDALPGIRPRGSNVLVACYVQPEKTTGGIIRPDASIQQDIWQGKCGLLLAWGKTAWKYDGAFPSEDAPPNVWDYVVFNSAEGRDCSIRGVHCKWIDSSLIRSDCDDPTDFY